MVVYALLALNILCLLATGINTWLAAKPTKVHHPKRTAERTLIVICTIFAIVLAIITGCDWGAELFSHTPVFSLMVSSTEWPQMANCTVSQIAIGPQERLKSLHLVLLFPEAIHSHRVLVERPNVNFGTQVAKPCDIDVREREPDPLLTFTVSTDQRHRDTVLFHYQLLSGRQLGLRAWIAANRQTCQYPAAGHMRVHERIS